MRLDENLGSTNVRTPPVPPTSRSKHRPHNRRGRSNSRASNRSSSQKQSNELLTIASISPNSRAKNVVPVILQNHPPNYRKTD
mmetsp:Transcript_28525/g.34816  ORF Transcript_28525/g.34816 Transcript_28525/m.34816 type:complete len:83 (-) Transcript_28525:526-774(-)